MARAEKHYIVDNNGKSDINGESDQTIERIKPAFYKPHFSLFAAMRDVNNNSAATATAAPGDSPKLVESSRAPTPSRSGRVVRLPQHFQEFECAALSPK